MAEQRYQAVLAVIAEGETVKDVAARWGVVDLPVFHGQMLDCAA